MTDDQAASIDAGSAAHRAAECPACFAPQRAGSDWWRARPDDARLVGLVIARDDMPSVVAQRDALSRFGVPIDGFRHPAPETLESWQERLARLFGRLRSGDVVVVATVHALGRDVAEELRTLAELQRRGVIVKVVDHAAGHLADTGVELASGRLGVSASDGGPSSATEPVDG